MARRDGTMLGGRLLREDGQVEVVDGPDPVFGREILVLGAGEQLAASLAAGQSAALLRDCQVGWDSWVGWDGWVGRDGCVSQDMGFRIFGQVGGRHKVEHVVVKIWIFGFSGVLASILRPVPLQGLEAS